jgi:hypothetical protein
MIDTAGEFSRRIPAVVRQAAEADSAAEFASSIHDSGYVVDDGSTDRRV